MLAQMLQQDGLEVAWDRPEESRGMAEMAEGYAVAMAVQGSIVSIRAAVAKFRKHAPQAEVDVDGDGAVDQTEDERIRALEFMLATRAQQEDQTRAAHAIQEVADHPDADPRAQYEEALHEHPEPPENDSPA
jgi:hypothetical protein